MINEFSSVKAFLTRFCNCQMPYLHQCGDFVCIRTGKKKRLRTCLKIGDSCQERTLWYELLLNYITEKLCSKEFKLK